MSIVVFGASGKTGQVLLPQLANTGQRVIGVVRRAEATAAVEATGATAALVDLETDIDGVAALFSKGDTVIWAAGANIATGLDHSDRLDRDACLRIIGQAESAQVDRWLQISSLYADRIDLAPPMLAHFLRNKVQADDAVRASSLRWSVVRPSGLTEGPPTGLIDVALEGMGYGQLPRTDLAATLTVMVTDDLAWGRSFDLTGGATPIREALSSL